MTRQLVFVHGRAQAFKRAEDLKSKRWRLGATDWESARQPPITAQSIRFPYYGQTLSDLVHGVSAEHMAQVIVRGSENDSFQRDFVTSVLEAVRREAGITDVQLDELGGDPSLVERGPQDWRWSRTIVKALDTHLPGASGTVIAIATNDVYQYLKNPGVRDVIESGVRAALPAGAQSVVVGHSLGTVVAYNLLKREGEALGWEVPLFVTLGSPLAVSAIRKALAPIGHPACVSHWFNAMDGRDLVALYPLDRSHFGIEPAIENKTDVCNETPNRHGIAGYLSDKEVAAKIYEGLVSDSRSAQP